MLYFASSRIRRGLLLAALVLTISVALRAQKTDPHNLPPTTAFAAVGFGLAGLGAGAGWRKRRTVTGENPPASRQRRRLGLSTQADVLIQFGLPEDRPALTTLRGTVRYARPGAISRPVRL